MRVQKKEKDKIHNKRGEKKKKNKEEKRLDYSLIAIITLIMFTS